MAVGCGPAGEVPPSSNAPSLSDSSKKGEAGSIDSAGDSSSTVTVRIADETAYQEVIASLRGKVVLVDFWATWCAPCMAQFSHTVELYKEFHGRGLAVVSVSLDDPSNEQAVLDFLAARGATFDNLISKYGGSPRTAEAFDIASGAVPHYKLYDGKGDLRYTFDLDPTAKKQFTTDDIRQRTVELLEEL
jgi:thiol-disulfide isomerase/thioredoxin